MRLGFVGAEQHAFAERQAIGLANAFAGVASENTPAAAVGTPYRSMKACAKTFEDSSWAACWFGPQMRKPCC